MTEEFHQKLKSPHFSTSSERLKIYRFDPIIANF